MMRIDSTLAAETFINFGMNLMSVDFIIPCYNPENNWAVKFFEDLNNIFNLLDSVKINIILVNDGSYRGIENGDIEFLKKNLNQFCYIHLSQNKGKGFALREGIKRSTAPVILYTDYDIPYIYSNYADFCNVILDKKADVVLGFRDTAYYKHIPLSRKVLTKAFNLVTKFIFRKRISETQAGIKAFSSELKSEFLNTKTDGYLIDFEFLYKLKKMKIITYCLKPITLRNTIKISKLRFSKLFQEIINLAKVLLLN